MKTPQASTRGSGPGISSTLLVLLTVLGLLAFPPAARADGDPPFTVVDGIRYEVAPEAPEFGAVVRSYDGSQGSTVTIRDSVEIWGELRPVIAIGDESVFQDFGITEVSLPQTLMYIGDDAFFKNRLRSVELPSSLAAIGRAAFYGNELTSLTLPDSVTEIALLSFGQNQIRDLKLSSALAVIPYFAFSGNSLNSVVIPASVENVQEWAFDGNAELSEVFFLGNAPEIVPASPNDDRNSFGPAEGKILFYSQCATGFSTPTWQGYATSDTLAYPVNFVSQGGSEIEGLLVGHGCTLEPPQAPTRDGYTFTGWFLDAEAETTYDFETPVTEPLTLYAAWLPVPGITHTVVFDTGGGTPIDPVTVNSGDPVTRPENPARDGFTFSGWQTGKTSGPEYDFTTPVTADLTLYAVWAPAKKTDPVPKPDPAPGPGTTPDASRGTSQLPKTDGPATAGLAWGGAGILFAGVTLLTIRRSRALRTGVPETSEY